MQKTLEILTKCLFLPSYPEAWWCSPPPPCPCWTSRWTSGRLWRTHSPGMRAAVSGMPCTPCRAENKIPFRLKQNKTKTNQNKTTQTAEILQQLPSPAAVRNEIKIKSEEAARTLSQFEDFVWSWFLFLKFIFCFLILQDSGSCWTHGGGLVRVRPESSCFCGTLRSGSPSLIIPFSTLQSGPLPPRDVPTEALKTSSHLNNLRIFSFFFISCKDQKTQRGELGGNNLRILWLQADDRLKRQICECTVWEEILHVRKITLSFKGL